MKKADPAKFVFILKGQDWTGQVKEFDVHEDKVDIIFKNAPEKCFAYNKTNTIIEKADLILDQTRTFEVNGEAMSGIQEIRESENYYRVVYRTGFTRAYEKKKSKILKSCIEEDNRKRIFNYFREISRNISLVTEDGKNILGDFYDKINFVREDSVLNLFLERKIEDNLDDFISGPYIFPFGTNLSQRKAVENACRNKVSIIQGPPGTGKTQTILNILANIVRNGKSAAVVSSNNSAIDNIYEKLEKYNLDFIAARLGNAKNKQQFIDDQRDYDIEMLASWKLSAEEMKFREDELESLDRRISELLALKNKLAEKEQELRNFRIERKDFIRKNQPGKTKAELSLKHELNSNSYLALWIFFETRQGKEKNLLTKIIAFFRFGVRFAFSAKRFYDSSFENKISQIQIKFYGAKEFELEADKRKIEAELRNSNLDGKMKRYESYSLDIFRNKLEEKYNRLISKNKTEQRKKYAINDLWKYSYIFIEDYPIVLSTTYSLRNSLNQNYVYDYLIIDEASQVNLATLILATTCAKRIVVVGDEKQLHNVISDDDKEIDNKIFSKYNISELYKTSKHSALEFVTTIFDNGIVPMQLLKEHYRCAPDIINFCNERFYNGELIILTKETSDDCLKLYETVKGNHARANHVNEREIDVFFEEVIKEEKLKLSDGSVGITTPYKNQAHEFQERLDGPASATLASTIDKFQGRERDIVVISSVDNEINDFTANPNRLNVAVSRAKKKLILIKNGNDNSNTLIDELAEYIQYRSGKTSSYIHSVFDLLYSAYYNSTEIKGSSKFLSENIVEKLLKEILSDDEFANLKYVAQYNLNYLVSPTELTSENFSRKIEYLKNKNTKVDFVILDKLTKSPKQVIEVDGWKYHYSVEAKKQKERDKLKNAILKDVNLPILRLRTTGSQEKEKIIAALRKSKLVKT